MTTCAHVLKVLGVWLWRPEGVGVYVQECAPGRILASKALSHIGEVLVPVPVLSYRRLVISSSGEHDLRDGQTCWAQDS